MINRWRSPWQCLAGTIIHDVSRISAESISKAINKDSFNNRHRHSVTHTGVLKALDDLVSISHSLCRAGTLLGDSDTRLFWENRKECWREGFPPGCLRPKNKCIKTPNYVNEVTWLPEVERREDSDWAIWGCLQNVPVHKAFHLGNRSMAMD